MALLHFGMFHTCFISGIPAVLGKLNSREVPVAFIYPIFTKPAFAVTHWRANGPPPVSQQTCLPVRLSNHLGEVTHVYLLEKSLFPGLGLVVLFQGWWRSTGLPAGSFSTNILSFSQ